MTWKNILGTAYGCMMAVFIACCPAVKAADMDPAATTTLAEQYLLLKLPKTDRVAFSGELDFQGADVGSGSILYPAPNAAGLIAALITHGLIVESQKSSQRTEAQKRADRIMEPFSPALENFSYPELAHPWLSGDSPSSPKRLAEDAASQEKGEWLIESAPVFLMAQDHRSLVLDNQVSIRTPGASEEAVQQVRVQIVSPPEESQDPTAAWTTDKGRKLKETCSRLFTESMDIALGVKADSTADRPFRTVRYLAGNAEKMERAQVIDKRCGRLLIKNLRGTLMSVPVKPLDTDCPKVGFGGI